MMQKTVWGKSASDPYALALSFFSPAVTCVAQFLTLFLEYSKHKNPWQPWRCTAQTYLPGRTTVRGVGSP